MRTSAVWAAGLIFACFFGLIRSEFQWAWIAGQNTTNGVSVTTGGSATPSARRDALVWQDPATSTVYLFGGYGNGNTAGLGFLKDLWRYNETSTSWTLINGPTAVAVATTYPTPNVPGSANPPRRRSSVGWVVSERKQLWLFGGYTEEGSGGQLNDFWIYQINASTWTYIGGSSTTKQLGNYGSIGQPSASNFPGAREQATSFSETDNFGNTLLYLFGGYGYAGDPGQTAGGYLNDLWRYNVSDGKWTWMSGFSYPNSYGFYSGGPPGGREGPMSWFVPSRREFWIFGGNGFASTNSSGVNHLSDVWRFKLSNLTWSFMTGSTVAGDGCTNTTYRTAVASNRPGARVDAVSWIDEGRNEAWIGFGYGRDCSGSLGYLSDVWRLSMVNSSWAFMSGSPQAGRLSTFGPLGQEGGNFVPGARNAPASWSSGRYMFVYAGATSSFFNDVWRFGWSPVPLGGICARNSDCASGNFCSSSGHCCSTVCNGNCLTCATGTCAAVPNGPMQSCPRVFCENFLSDWQGFICATYAGYASGYCLNGECDSGASRCASEGAGIKTLGRPSCGSLGCQNVCPANALASNYSSVSDVCFQSGQRGCSAGNQCDSTGTCVSTSLPDGSSCSNGTQCASGYCSVSGHCCGSSCSSPCTSCSTGTCLNLSDGTPSAACPVVNCSLYLFGWSSLTCATYAGSVQGQCINGTCSSSASMCSAQTARLAGRPSCISVSCQKQCPIGALAANYSSSSAVCACQASNCPSEPPQPTNLFSCDSISSEWVLSACNGNPTCSSNESVSLGNGTVLAVNIPIYIAALNSNSSLATIKVNVGAPLISGGAPAIKVGSCPILQSPIKISIPDILTSYQNVTILEYEECVGSPDPPQPLFESASWDPCRTGYTRTVVSTKSSTTVSFILIFGSVDRNSQSCASAPTTLSGVDSVFPTGIVAGVVSAIAVVLIVGVGTFLILRYRRRGRQEQQDNAAELYTREGK